MKVWNIGTDFKIAPLEIRSRSAEKSFALDYRSLAPEAAELLLISTCNRVELLGVGEVDLQETLNRWLEKIGMTEKDKVFFRMTEGVDCIQHLFRVVSSMESMVVGETQIVGQIKKAYEKANQDRTVGPILHRLFQSAFRVAKRIRRHTEVGKLAVSVPSIGVKLAEKILGNLSEKRIGIIGLGEIGRVSAEHFASVQPKELLLYNRTASVAEEIAANLKDQWEPIRPVTSIDPILELADVIISAVDGIALEAKHLQKLDLRDRPSFVLDLSVPRSIEAVPDLQRVFSFSIDDLRKIAEENIHLRENEIERAVKIIQEEVAICFAQISPASVSQAFGLLASKMEKLTQEELKILRGKMNGVSPKDWSEIERMAYRLTSKVLQDPMKELKSQIQTGGESESLVQFFRSIFRV